MRRKVLIYVTLALAGVALLVGLIMASQLAFAFMQIAPPTSRSQSTMERLLEKHEDVLVETAEYLGELDYAYIYIADFEDNQIFASTDGVERCKYIEITDDAIALDISCLLENYHYQVITKENNGVYFQRWSNLDYGRGLVYSLDGEKLENEHLTVLEPLAEEHWYFYEEE